MTTIFPEPKECFVCKHISEFIELGSTNVFGSPDLDTRPPEMERSTISYWIQICPNCFYSAPDISKGDPRIRDIVESEEYKKIGRDLDFPDKTAGFICHSHIMDRIGNFEEAAWACLHAAWYCDDDEMELAAGLCREKAVVAFQKAREYDDTLLSVPEGAFDALLVDLLRRRPNLPDAGDYCVAALERQPDDLILKILLFQKDLIIQRDKGCYTIEDAIQD